MSPQLEGGEGREGRRESEGGEKAGSVSLSLSEVE